MFKGILRNFRIGLLTLSAVSIAAAEDLPFWSNGDLVHREIAVNQAGPRDDQVLQQVRVLFLPGKSLGVDRLLPQATTVDEVVIVGSAIVARLTIPKAFLIDGSIDDQLLQQLSMQLDFGLAGFPELREFHIVARSPGEADYRSLPSYLPRWQLVGKGDTEGQLSTAPLVTRLRPEGGTVTGALDGKLLFISQAHGFIDYGAETGWSTQRGITNSIVEDFHNAEAINQYLIPYLEHAGAMVFTVREPDQGSAMVIVDEGDGSGSPANGTYVESGDAGAFAASGQDGFANFQAPYDSVTNPFRDTDGTARLMATTASETARATWTPVIPTSGFYTVQVSYTRDGSNRASDAHYVVIHSGGATDVLVNQERHGWTWVPIGRFWFEAGFDPAVASVALVNDSTEVGDTVSADAVRFGGGMGDTFGAVTTDQLSGRPRWEEGAQVYVQYLGAPTTVYASSDVTARSKWAAYEHFSVEDSIYLSWHSNAFDTTARGTSSYIYSSNPPDGSYSTGDAAPGSVELMNLVHDEIVADIRAAWDPGWSDRGYRSAYFGEINPTYNNEMPSCLLEVAFHDNAADAEALSEPHFRRLLARAVYQGIVKYFADRDTIPVRLLPEPPEAVEAHSSGNQSITVSWLPSPTDVDGVFGDAAESYRVYLSLDGKGFDGGTPVTGTSATLVGFDPGETMYVRVTGVNQGGESMPTETLAVRLPSGGTAGVLLVNGFDRLDRFQLVSTNDPDLGGTVLRMFLEKMNTFDYVVEHAEALKGVPLAVDSTSNEAVESGRVALDPATHKAVMWILGEESTVDETFSPAEQDRVSTYLAAGGQLMVTGAEIGWDLEYLGDAADQVFYNDVLLTDYVADDAGVYEAEGEAGSLLADVISMQFDDGNNGNYDVAFPDVIAPQGGATLCGTYISGSDGACVQAETDTYRVVNIGFPFETIYPLSARAEVMEAVVDFFDLAQLFADGFEEGDLQAWSASIP